MIKMADERIDKETKKALRDEQEELRMRGAMRMLRPFFSPTKAGNNAERERFRRMPTQR